jgi:exopolysaccharide biosynthesis polyprenyl glycosylphosphotransferase
VSEPDPKDATTGNGSPAANKRRPDTAKLGPATGRRSTPRDLLPTVGRVRFRTLPIVDGLVLIAVMAGINLVRYGPVWPTYPLPSYVLSFLVATAIALTTFYFGGLYESEVRLGQRPLLPRVAGQTLLAVLVFAVVTFLVGQPTLPFPRANLAALVVFGALAVTAVHQLARVLRVQREGRPRVLLVGAPDDVTLAKSHLTDNDRDAVAVGESSTAQELLTQVEQARASEVLLLSSAMLDSVYPEPLSTLERRGVGVLQRVSARDTLLGLEGVREIAGMPFVALRAHTLPLSRARFKRTLELLGTVVVAPLVLPLLLAVAAYIRVVAGPPVLFWQERVGRDGTRFRMCKFRTMYPEAEEGVGPLLAHRGDPRVVPACEWLRSSRIDELPQLWNVVRGEMSAVGPRPERPELTAQYEELIPGYARRHEIPPGITGLAQIHGRYHTDPEYKLGHDLQYLVNWSPVLDLQVLGRTVWVVLSRRL